LILLVSSPMFHQLLHINLRIIIFLCINFFFLPTVVFSGENLWVMLFWGERKIFRFSLIEALDFSTKKNWVIDVHKCLWWIFLHNWNFNFFSVDCFWIFLIGAVHKTTSSYSLNPNKSHKLNSEFLKNYWWAAAMRLIFGLRL
jgi:hypothetical protein